MSADYLLNVILMLLVIHWIADFVCQNDWIATNKHKNWGALSLHIGLYSAVLFAGMVLLLTWMGTPSGGGFLATIYRFVGANAVAHFVTDAITSRINARLYHRRPRAFFMVLGFDQILHLWAMLLLFRYFYM